MTAKQHISEAEKDAKECEQQIRAALLKAKHHPSLEDMALAWMLTAILEKQIEVNRMIKQLLT